MALRRPFGVDSRNEATAQMRPIAGVAWAFARNDGGNVAYAVLTAVRH